jgi:hypothetical protein
MEAVKCPTISSFLEGEVLMLNRHTLQSFVAVTSLFLILPSAWAKPAAKAHGHAAPSARTDQTTPLTTQQIARLALPSIVSLTVLDASGKPSVQGSGIVVGKNLIATNVHVIKGAHAVTANFQNGRSEKVYGLVALDDARDLALIYANTSGIRELPLAADGHAQVGDPVVAVGNPEGLGGSLSTGIISAIRLLGNTKVLQTTAPISHGSSGGALLDVYGRVLGVTSFYIGDGQNLNFAYASYHLKQLFPKQLLTYRNWSELEPLWAGPVVPPAPPAPPAPVAEAPPVLPSPPAAPAATQADLGFTDKPLTGLKGVTVVIGDLRPDAIADGLDSAQLKTDVELRLRKAGIKVFDKIGDPDNTSLATLDININTIKSTEGIYSYSLMVKVNELVRLVRPVPKLTLADTWKTSEVGHVGALNMPASLRQDVNDNTDQFINDYLAQNPKQ